MKNTWDCEKCWFYLTTELFPCMTKSLLLSSSVAFLCLKSCKHIKADKLWFLDWLEKDWTLAHNGTSTFFVFFFSFQVMVNCHSCWHITKQSVLVVFANHWQWFPSVFQSAVLCMHLHLSSCFSFLCNFSDWNLKCNTFRAKIVCLFTDSSNEFAIAWAFVIDFWFTYLLLWISLAKLSFPVQHDCEANNAQEESISLNFHHNHCQIQPISVTLLLNAVLCHQVQWCRHLLQNIGCFVCLNCLEWCSCPDTVTCCLLSNTLHSCNIQNFATSSLSHQFRWSPSRATWGAETKVTTG